MRGLTDFPSIHDILFDAYEDELLSKRNCTVRSERASITIELYLFASNGTVSIGSRLLSVKAGQLEIVVTVDNYQYLDKRVNLDKKAFLVLGMAYKTRANAVRSSLHPRAVAFVGLQTAPGVTSTG